MSYYPGRYQLSTPKQNLIWLPLVAAIVSALVAAALAAAAVAVVPGTAANLAGIILCPSHTMDTKLVTISVDSSASRDHINVVKCYDAQGSELAGSGDSFQGLWWGAWMGMAAVVGAIVCFAVVFTKSKKRPAHGNLVKDSEKEELRRLEESKSNKKK